MTRKEKNEQSEKGKGIFQFAEADVPYAIIPMFQTYPLKFPLNPETDLTR